MKAVITLHKLRSQGTWTVIVQRRKWSREGNLLNNSIVVVRYDGYLEFFVASDWIRTYRLKYSNLQQKLDVNWRPVAWNFTLFAMALWQARVWLPHGFTYARHHKKLGDGLRRIENVLEKYCTPLSGGIDVSTTVMFVSLVVIVLNSTPSLNSVNWSTIQIHNRSGKRWIHGTSYYEDNPDEPIKTSLNKKANQTRKKIRVFFFPFREEYKL